MSEGRGEICCVGKWVPGCDGSRDTEVTGHVEVPFLLIVCKRYTNFKKEQ